MDASVAIKWLLPEVHSEAALRLLSPDHSLIAPDLFFAEVGNVLWKRVSRGEVTVTQARAALEALLAVPLQVHRSQLLMPLALEIACGTRRSVYDSLYLAAAVLGGCPLVTADRKLHDAVRKSGFSSHVLLVAELA